MTTLSPQQIDWLETLFGERMATRRVERKLYSHNVGEIPALIKPLIGNPLAGAVVQPQSAEEIIVLVRWLGERVVIADRFFPSSRRCSVCGAINAELTLSERVWTCGCGVVHDRDLNAARNLAQLATTVSSTGSHACGEDVSPVLNRQTSTKQEPNRSLGSA